MGKKTMPARPFFDVKFEYEASLKAYTEAALILRISIGSVLRCADEGLDIKSALDDLRIANKAFELAAHGGDI